MKHCFVVDGGGLLANWREAFPEAESCRRDAVSGLEADLLWIRLSPGEAPADILSAMAMGGARRLVVLADEPGEAVVVQALGSGASGCCNTHAAPEVLQQVALVVGNGGLWIGQALLQQVLASTSRIVQQRAPQADASQASWAASLSGREVEVARLIAAGESNKEIAAELAITERTVKAHLTAIFEKLQVRDRLQLSLRVNGLKR